MSKVVLFVDRNWFVIIWVVFLVDGIQSLCGMCTCIARRPLKPQAKVNSWPTFVNPVCVRSCDLRLFCFLRPGIIGQLVVFCSQEHFAERHLAIELSVFFVFKIYLLWREIILNLLLAKLAQVALYINGRLNRGMFITFLFASDNILMSSDERLFLLAKLIFLWCWNLTISLVVIKCFGMSVTILSSFFSI